MKDYLVLPQNYTEAVLPFVFFFFFFVLWKSLHSRGRVNKKKEKGAMIISKEGV